MAVARTVSSGYMERWEELVAADFDGGDTVVIDTDIPGKGNADSSDYVDCDMYVNTVVGTPLPQDPVLTTYVDTDNRTKYRITLQNTAAPGNQATYEVQIWLRHSQHR